MSFHRGSRAVILFTELSLAGNLIGYFLSRLRAKRVLPGMHYNHPFCFTCVNNFGNRREFTLTSYPGKH